MAGIVVEVAVQAGDRVATGDVLFRIDDRTARLAMAERTAEVAAAKARLEDALAQLALLAAQRDGAQARLAEAEARVRDLARDVEVGERLAAENAVAAREAERRVAALAAGEAHLAAARADLASAETALALADPQTGAAIAVARAGLTEAEARLASAQSDLEALAVRAREAGTVLSVEVRHGQPADPSQTAVELAPDDGVILRVFVNEADAGRVDTGRDAIAMPLGRRDGSQMAQYLATEPIVRPNAELSGRPTDLIDTRVVEFLYELPAGVDVLFGQTFDVALPSRETVAPTVAFSGDQETSTPPQC